MFIVSGLIFSILVVSGLIFSILVVIGLMYSVIDLMFSRSKFLLLEPTAKVSAPLLRRIKFDFMKKNKNVLRTVDDAIIVGLFVFVVMLNCVTHKRRSGLALERIYLRNMISRTLHVSSFYKINSEKTYHCLRAF